MVAEKDRKDKKGVKLITVHGHCHAPTCLRFEMYNADNGQLICRNEPIYGKGIEKEKFDEKGFIQMVFIFLM